MPEICTVKFRFVCLSTKMKRYYGLYKKIAEDDYEAVNSGKLSIFKLKK